MIDWLTDWPDAAAWRGVPTVWAGRLATAPAPVTPSPEDQRGALLRPPARREPFLRGRAAARGFVAALTGADPERVSVSGNIGPPSLLAPHDGLTLSLAQREGWLALALARQPVGVDLEVTDPAQEPAWNMLAPAETAQLQALPPSERWAAFLALWTGKEAYLKALGVGLAREPRDVSVAISAGRLSIRDRGEAVATSAAEHRSLQRDGALLQLSCISLGTPPSRRG